MNGRDIFRGLQYIGDDLIENAETGQFPAQNQESGKTHRPIRRPLLIAAVIATTPLLKALGERFSSGGLRTAYAYNALQMFVPPLLLLLSTAALVGNSYNPFLYFQF